MWNFHAKYAVNIQVSLKLNYLILSEKDDPQRSIPQIGSYVIGIANGRQQTARALS